MDSETKKRPIIGVIAAGASFIEQRQIINGIVAQAQLYNIDTAVFSNIYNPNITNEQVFAENLIYELATSPELDALILISESFVNPDLRMKVREYLKKQLHLPIIVIGAKMDEFDLNGVRFINTSDIGDIEDITDHLIERHGFTKIDIISGFEYLEASHLRVEGYKRSLERHGIEFDERRVIFGNFWYNTGEELAKSYISGERPFPQALICCNDYMAYGLLDVFSENRIPIPQKMTVIGYEYIRERVLHSPTLTTYQRARVEIGRSAVKLIFEKLNTGKDADFIPPKGRLISGNTCSCGCDPVRMNDELKSAREKEFYESQNLMSQLEPQLTACQTLDDFIKIAGDHQFLVRYVQDIYLCLSENWFDTNAMSESDFVSFRSMIPWHDTSVRTMDRYKLSAIFADSEQAAVYYFNPLFYSDRMFGWITLRYDNPDTYDDIYRYFLKTISNALVFMRMKNDISYLMECQNLSEYYDSETGIYNGKGFVNALKYAVSGASKGQRIIFILMRTQLLSYEASMDDLEKKISIATEMADCIKLLTRYKGDLCGRIDRNLYAFASVGDYPEDFADTLVDKLRTLVIHKTYYVNDYGMGSFACSGLSENAEDFDFEKCKSQLVADIKDQTEHLMQKSSITNYGKFSEYRNNIYLHPTDDVDVDSICKCFCFSTGHFRHLYKSCFDVSFHQDCILSRMTLAKFLLCTTSLDVNVIASRCGYDDQKYFMRLFQQNTSYTPSKYRGLFYK